MLNLVLHLKLLQQSFSNTKLYWSKIPAKFDGIYLKQNKVTFNHKIVVNIYIVFGVNLGPFKQSVDLTLGNSFFGAVKLTKNADFDKYKHSGYGIDFDAHVNFSFSDCSGFGKFISAC